MTHRTRITLAILGAAVLLTAWLVSPARAVDYGSGQLGTWQNWGHSDQTDTVQLPGTVSWDTADVGIIGDSITGRCYPRLATRLAAQGKTLAVNYWSGRPTTPAADWVVQRVTDGKPMPDRTVMAVGTNDIFNPPAVAGQPARIKAVVPDAFWVDVTATRWGSSYSTASQVSDMRNSSWVNGMVRAAVPDSQVISWAAQVASTPGRGVLLTHYIQDGVHPWSSAIDGHGDGCDLWAFTLMAKIAPTAAKARR